MDDSQESEWDRFEAGTDVNTGGEGQYGSTGTGEASSSKTKAKNDGAVNVDEPVVIFRREDRTKTVGDSLAHAHHRILKASLLLKHSKTFHNLLEAAKNPNSAFDPENRLCCRVSVRFRNGAERKTWSIFLNNTIQYCADNFGDENARLMLAFTPNTQTSDPLTVWELLSEWFSWCLKSEKPAQLDCPWRKEKLLIVSRFIQADKEWIDAVEALHVRAKVYMDEEQDLDYAKHKHPDWVRDNDPMKYGRMRPESKVWKSKKKAAKE
ncbi:uncharacterized protein L3040_007792 [Drepanopeziza brunnea f. sp. 'multigermtubi']|uniref:Uncharacterized protein n=1 Tax=Marssonina brunnea f. sp. multigermtubi (strain MB_m1) TaxID=1072389 RepID=K1X660_MARBU|nr:uncharacterized protein MBM_05412 [Drepanopeziza brunnea f. sp. 'multigermtubi' MB_m1]EKD16118.1 hypothetical protein MBM_05412 [Drepanopeziza brunnea f. sp. 'multigermtubi' MB_m1]KAJ5035317.1 hypothetical protein L3040_007792 [Drepanopeziza brunnea f. sp. 'multigermtubi']